MKIIIPIVVLMLFVSDSNAQPISRPGAADLIEKGKNIDTSKKAILQSRLTPPPPKAPPVSAAEMIGSWGLKFYTSAANGKIDSTQSFILKLYSNGTLYIRPATAADGSNNPSAPPPTNGSYSFSNNHISMSLRTNPTGPFAPLEGDMSSKTKCEGSAKLPNAPKRTFRMWKYPTPVSG